MGDDVDGPTPLAVVTKVTNEPLTIIASSFAQERNIPHPLLIGMPIVWLNWAARHDVYDLARVFADQRPEPGDYVFDWRVDSTAEDPRLLLQVGIERPIQTRFAIHFDPAADREVLDALAQTEAIALAYGAPGQPGDMGSGLILGLIPIAEMQRLRAALEAA
jgi:hypothetical protein